MCYGHFLKPSEALKSTLTPMASPPSTAIKEAFEKLTVYPPPDHELVCNEVEKHVLLSPDQIRMWFEHLHTVKENRKRGAARAAATRRISKRKKKGRVPTTVLHVEPLTRNLQSLLKTG